MHSVCKTMLVSPAVTRTKLDVGSRGRILRQVINNNGRENNGNIYMVDVVSANGDVKADILYTRRNGEPMTLSLYKSALRMIYGIEEWDGIFDEVPAAVPTKPVLIPNSFPFGAQSFSELKQEAKRTYQETRRNSSTAPKRLLENDDMVAILNARGTVVLNLAFRAHPKQLPIIKLASLAVCLWGELEVCKRPIFDETLSQSLQIALTQQDSAQGNAIHRIITLIRDDIHSHILEAATNLSPILIDSQQRHIDVLRESIKTWQVMTNKRITPDWEDMADTIRNLREKCNDVLAYDSQTHRDCLLWAGKVSAQTRFVQDHGSEFIGALLRDENCRAAAREVEIRFLSREDSGFWFLA